MGLYFVTAIVVGDQGPKGCGLKRQGHCTLVASVLNGLRWEAAESHNRTWPSIGHVARVSPAPLSRDNQAACSAACLHSDRSAPGGGHQGKFLPAGWVGQGCPRCCGPSGVPPGPLRCPGGAVFPGSHLWLSTQRHLLSPVPPSARLLCSQILNPSL